MRKRIFYAEIMRNYCAQPIICSQEQKMQYADNTALIRTSGNMPVHINAALLCMSRYCDGSAPYIHCEAVGGGETVGVEIIHISEQVA